jgi:polyhydroxybutyrate depolymerase
LRRSTLLKIRNSLGHRFSQIVKDLYTFNDFGISCSGALAESRVYSLTVNPKDDLVSVSQGLSTREHALAQNRLQPLSRSCEPRGLNCECYGSPDTPNPVVWCSHTEDHNRRGKFYPHLWPREAGEVIMEFFDALPRSAR